MFEIVGPSELHFSIFEFSAIENERMIPQEAASTVTNVDDIEEFIKSKEVDSPYLRAIDLPIGERKKVVRDLDTWASPQARYSPAWMAHARN